MKEAYKPDVKRCEIQCFDWGSTLVLVERKQLDTGQVKVNFMS
jgi:hypothetical protein